MSRDERRPGPPRPVRPRRPATPRPATTEGAAPAPPPTASSEAAGPGTLVTELPRPADLERGLPPVRPDAEALMGAVGHDGQEPLVRAVGGLGWEEPPGVPWPVPAVSRPGAPRARPVVVSPSAPEVHEPDREARVASARQWAAVGGAGVLLLASLGVLAAVLIGVEDRAVVEPPVLSEVVEARPGEGDGPPRVATSPSPAEAAPSEAGSPAVPPTPSAAPPEAPDPLGTLSAPPRSTAREEAPRTTSERAPVPPQVASSPSPQPVTAPASTAGAAPQGEPSEGVVSVLLSENWGGGELTLRCSGPADRYALRAGRVRLDGVTPSCRAFVKCDLGGASMRVDLPASGTLRLGGCNEETPAPAVR